MITICYYKKGSPSTARSLDVANSIASAMKSYIQAKPGFVYLGFMPV